MPPVSLVPRCPRGQVCTLNTAIRFMLTASTPRDPAAVDRLVPAAQMVLIRFLPAQKVEPPLSPVDAFLDTLCFEHQAHPQVSISLIVAAIIQVEGVSVVEYDCGGDPDPGNGQEE